MKVSDSRTKKVFRELLRGQSAGHCSIKGVSPAAAHRLYHGQGSTSPKVIDMVARHFGAHGCALIAAWLEDKAAELPSNPAVVVVVKIKVPHLRKKGLAKAA